MRSIILGLMLAFAGHTLLAQTLVEVFVNSRGENAVKLYDESGNYIEDFIAPGDGGLNTTEDVVFHPDGRVLVTGYNNTAIKSYDGVTGDYLGDFSTGYSLNSPSKMSIGPDSLIYVTQWDATNNKVVRFDLDGNFVDEFTSIGAPNGLGHVWDVNGNFYISLYGSSGDGTVHRFDSDGNDLGTFINSAFLQGPTDIWWDAAGNMLVQDWLAGKILRYDFAGNYIDEFVTGLTNPEGIAFLPDGRMLVGDWGQDAVHLIGTDGTVFGHFCSGDGLTDPNNVAVRVTDLSTGIEPVVIEETFVFPSIGDQFVIQAPAALSGAKVIVVDYQGQLVREMETMDYFSATALPAGVYFVIAQQQNLRATQKIIVQH